MKYFLYKDFDPVGILSENGNIIAFSEEHNSMIKELLKNQYSLDIEKEDISILIKSQEEDRIRDRVIFLQLNSFHVEPISDVITENIRKEIEKL